VAGHPEPIGNTLARNREERRHENLVSGPGALAVLDRAALPRVRRCAAACGQRAGSRQFYVNGERGIFRLDLVGGAFLCEVREVPPPAAPSSPREEEGEGGGLF
jgi:hypothetical protein